MSQQWFSVKETWTKLETRLRRSQLILSELILGVHERIKELKILELSIRQPAQIQERIIEGRMISPTLVLRLTQIPARAIQFESVEIQQQAKEWTHKNMNITTVPLLRLHKLHEEIIEELNLREESTSKINIQVEKLWAAFSQKLEQITQERDQIEKEYHQLKDALETTCKEI